MRSTPENGLVLLVEPETRPPTDRSPVADALRAAGLYVQCHSDPAQALGALPEEGPLLVIVDSAIIAGANLVWLGVFAEIGLGPVLLMANEEPSEGVGRALRAGADDFVHRAELLEDPEYAARLLAHSLARYQQLHSGAGSEPASSSDDFFASKARPAIRHDPLEGYVAESLHEFCTPLTVMREFTSILAEGLGGDLTGKQAEYLGYIEDASSDLLERFDAFRDAVRLRCQALPFEPKDCDVEVLFERALGRARARLDARFHVVSHSIATGARRIRADEHHLEQVLVAMLRRAAKVTPRGGTVRLWARPGPSGQVELGVTDDGPRPTSNDVTILRDGSLADGIHSRSVTRVFGVDMELARSLARIGGGELRLATAPAGGAEMSLRVDSAATAEAAPHCAVEVISTEKSLRRYTHSPDAPSHTK